MKVIYEFKHLIIMVLFFFLLIAQSNAQPIHLKTSEFSTNENIFFNTIYSFSFSGYRVADNQMWGNNQPFINGPNDEEELDTNQTNANFNTLNLGLITREGDKVYYSNFNDNQSLYCLDMVNQSNRKLLDGPCYFINIYDEWIFFTDKNYSLYRIRKDGSDKKNLFGEGCLYITVVDGWIYFSLWPDIMSTGQDKRQGIFRVSLDGEIVQQLTNIYAQSFTVKDEWIYYNTLYSDLFKIQVDGTEKMKLFKDHDWLPPLTSFCKINDWFYLFFGSNSGQNDKSLDFVRIHKDGNLFRKFECMDIDWSLVPKINVAGSWIFYRNKKKQVCRMNIEGNEKSVIFDQQSSYINIDQDLLYIVHAKENKMYCMQLDGSGLQLFPPN